MAASFQKILYDKQQGFCLHHTVGEEASGSTTKYAHRYTANMLLYFICGTGSIRIEGKQYDIHEGDIILVNPNELFCCTVDSNVYHERIVLYVTDSVYDNFSFATPNLLAPFTDRDPGVGNRIPAKAVQANGLDALLHTLLKLCQHPTPTSGLLSACKLAELLVQLKPASTHNPSAEISKHDNPLIDDILVYINSHYQQDISLSAIADHFSFHKSYLSHLFTEQMGMSLWNYVILRRLNAFDELIRQGVPIEEACYQVGFQNYSNFFRLYKKYTGMTPIQFKKQLLKK